MRIGYVSRFREGHATERDMAAALRRQGVEVVELPHEDPATWALLGSRVARRPLEWILWTPAHLAGDVPGAVFGELPVVGYHLDKWWGLRREAQLIASAFPRCDLVVTADGGHEERWAELGVRHRWLPPAVDAGEAAMEGRFTPGLSTDVCFVGSWRSYLPDWPHRRQLIGHLKRWFGPRLGVWPMAGPVRGQALADVYASARVVVGDSCLAGGSRYWSDRIPETLGRGGFLLHPKVDGLELHHLPGEHLATWPAGDWRALREALERWLADDEGRSRLAAAGREHTLAHHTYDHRAAQLLELVRAEGLA